MDNLTPNYGLLYPPSGEDFVDVESQLDNNLRIIDDVLYRNVNYKFYDNVKQSALPVSGMNRGDKLYSTYDHSVKVWDGNSWSNTLSADPVYTDVPYPTGFISTGNPKDSPLPGYYVKDGVVYTRGIFSRSGLAIWPQGQIVNVFPAGSFPSPVAVRSKITMGGLSSSSTAQFYQVDFKTDGSVAVTKYGNTAQTAGSAENYVSITGLWYEMG